MFKSCLNLCLYEDRTTSCIGLQNYAPPLQNRLPHIITNPTKSPPLQNHQPYKITSLTKSPTLQNHLPYKITNPTKTSSLQNHLPYKIASPTKSSTLQKHQPYKHTNPTKSTPLHNHQPCNMASLQNRLPYIEGSTSTNLEAIQKFVQMLFTGYFRSLSICECGI